MKLKAISQKAFIRGLVMTSDPLMQLKGSVPRGSNLLLSKRGSLVTCDGTQPIHAFNGIIQNTRGKMLASYLYTPQGVLPYYLALAVDPVRHINAPQNLVGALAAGGSLANATWFYVITALDGIGGETTASNEVSVATSGGNNSVQLTWNTVPNAVAYNIYRSTSTGTETLLTASASLPVQQPASGSLTQTFTDTGITGNIGVAITSITKTDPNTFVFILSSAFLSPQIPTLGTPINVVGSSNSAFNSAYQALTGYQVIASGISAGPQGGNINATPSAYIVASRSLTSGIVVGTVATGGTVGFAPSPPSSDSTVQVVLYRMPTLLGESVILPASYSGNNIVALYPGGLIGPLLSISQSLWGGGGGADFPLVAGIFSGAGGGGFPRSVLPQMVTHTNRVAIALGNAYPPQLYSDPNVAINPASAVGISSISVDGFGTVTVNTASPHGLTTAQLPASITITGNVIAAYVGAYAVVQVASATQLILRNTALIGTGAGGAGGTVTVNSVSITSTFTPAFPNWLANTAFGINSVVGPTVGNAGNFYFKAIQGGTSSAGPVTWPQTVGQQVADGTIIWQNAGLINSAAPPPPGAAHLYVFSNALWAFNTSPTDTTNGLDGPSSLRMSDIGNPTSWNPINQAFLDKDDGTEGNGLISFTITAQGIPPQSSLIAFKFYAIYQIIGIFGAANFAIQRVKTSMGSLASRSAQFVPGFGIIRYAHLGFAVFDGVEDRVISEETRPLLFESTLFDDTDLTPLDATFQYLMWGFQTAQPAMYCAAIPIGNSGGKLTRILCYDLVLKAWTPPVDLPWAISTAAQFVSPAAAPVTVLGGYLDGLLSRWQAADVQWDTNGSGSRTPTNVSWSVRTPTTAAQNPDQPLFMRRLMIRGINGSSAAGIRATLRIGGVAQPSYTSPAFATGDTQVEIAVDQTALRFEADLSGSGAVELSAFTWMLVPKPVGRPLVLT